MRELTSGCVVVENNSLADIAEQMISGEAQTDKYQKALNQLKAVEKEFENEHCAGMSQDACSAESDDLAWEQIKGAAGFGADFIPIVGGVSKVLLKQRQQ
ncbi:hypothetical protein ABK905_25350 [Acerihabitans sp. KWT182]|uniref:Uncharacterized protein n=1 Tax=Acerihabitans sp. KWT182 TaxID=3157919 RepID=A0AAU7Q9B4_9GAMM